MKPFLSQLGQFFQLFNLRASKFEFALLPLCQMALRALSDKIFEAALVEVKIGLIKFTAPAKLHLACYH